MRLIWTKNKMPLSWLIRWGLDEPVSHFAIVFDDRLVFHSNLKGVNVDWFDNFKKHHTIVFERHFNVGLSTEEKVYLDVIGKKIGKPYDFLGFIYFAYIGLKKKLFGTKTPNDNIFNQPEAYLCTELADVIYGFMGVDKTQKELAMISPYQLYLDTQNIQKKSKIIYKNT